MTEPDHAVLRSLELVCGQEVWVQPREVLGCYKQSSTVNSDGSLGGQNSNTKSPSKHSIHKVSDGKRMLLRTNYSVFMLCSGQKLFYILSI